ncbi:MAG: hypothetical protein ACETWM_13485 [Candidatus Lokiarchaeia archaeon]
MHRKKARALAYPIYTEAADFNELRDVVKDAVRCHFEEEETPRIIRLHFPNFYGR